MPEGSDFRIGPDEGFVILARDPATGARMVRMETGPNGRCGSWEPFRGPVTPNSYRRYRSKSAARIGVNKSPPPPENYSEIRILTVPEIHREGTT